MKEQNQLLQRVAAQFLQGILSVHQPNAGTSLQQSSAFLDSKKPFPGMIPAGISSTLHSL